MAVTADEVVVKLRADLAEYDRKISASTRATDAAFSRIEKSSNAVEATLRRNSAQMQGTMKGLAGSLATYFTGRELTGLLDSFTRLQNNLRVAGVEGDALRQVQDRLFATAQKYGVEIEGLSNLYGQLTQASKELGATQNQVFGITEAVSASLKITGISSEEASGALLQLTQALRGGKVQAEEYNSLLDGLYPLLEAAANGSDRFKGSVATLTSQVKAGKVTSKEFFDAILAGSNVLEDKAAKATLTLSAGFTTLTNSLTVYFGEADKANGVSAALGSALRKVADNLDSLIPAIAIIATAMGVNYAVGAVNAANATAALSGGLTVLQRLPVVAAITAIAAAIAYVGLESARAEARIANLNSNFDALTKKVDGATARAIAAGQNIAIVGNASVTAAGKVDQLGKAFQSAAGQAATLAAQAKIATLAMIGAERTKTKNELSRLEGQQRSSGVVDNTFGIAFAPVDYLSGERGRRAARQDRRADQIADLRKRLADLERLEGQAVQVDPKAFVEPKVTPVTPSVAGPKVKPSGASGPSPEETALRQEQDLSRLRTEELQARLGLTTNLQDRAALQKKILEEERDQRLADIKNNKALSAAQKAAQVKALTKIYGASTPQGDGDILVTAPGLLQQGIDQELERDQRALAIDALASQRQALEAGASLLTNRRDRLAAEQRILEIVGEQERLELETAIAAGRIADADKARAELAERQSARKASAAKSGASPMEAYIAKGQDDLSNLGDRVEQVQVNALERLTDGIAQAGAEYVKLGGIAGDVINGIISDLLRLAAQQAILAVLGGGAGGGVGGGFGGALVAGLGSTIGAARSIKPKFAIVGGFKPWRAFP